MPQSTYQMSQIALEERRREILTFVVDSYIESGSPVSSRHVANRGGLNVSSATIRSEMGWLCEAGYLMRPHASSGAMPSAQGYRHFVEGLEESPPPAGLTTLFQDSSHIDFDDIDAWARVASAVIADLVGALAFITAPRVTTPSVRSVELVAVRDMLIMLLVVLQGAEVYRSLIETDRKVEPSELDRARNVVTSKVAGRSVTDLVASESDAQAPLDDPLCNQVWDATMSTLKQSAMLPGRRHVSGYSKMLAEPEMVSDPELGVIAMEVIEDDATFSSMVSSVYDSKSPVISIGAEGVREGMENLSVIMCSYGDDHDGHGIVGLMAPLRLQYGRAIPVVHYTAERLGSYVGRP